MDFSDFFARASGVGPFPYQVRLATREALPDLLEAPTGAGKTAGAVLTWLWRRRYASAEVRAATPRRLVYCLPMRTLVEQTVAAARGWLDRLGLDDVGLHAMLGGAVDQDWESRPDGETIIIGTQDQLLSRALNRGYAMSRYRWPIHFAWLNNDCLWVFDEVQLMGVGLSTSAQLQALRERWGTVGPTHTLWMSATLDPGRVATVDHRRELSRLSIEEEDRAAEPLRLRLQARKDLTRATTPYSKNRYARELAAEIQAAHLPGTRTLVIVNRVERAQALYEALDGARLLHSRFRPADRKRIQDEVLDPDWTGILVATQAVEAGVDISARTLFTELAPWSSLVQRFGRCNRRGEYDGAEVRWIDLPDEAAPPYAPEELEAARTRLAELDEVSITRLERYRDLPGRPVEPVIRAPDLRELFGTDSDLAGHDIDISAYIRDAQSKDVHVAWRALEGPPPPDSPALRAEELCAVPIDQLRKYLRRQGPAWRWDHLDRQWVEADGLVPGMQVLLPVAAGGYHPNLGWTGNQKHRPPAAPVVGLPEEDDSADRFTYGCSRFVTLVEHSDDVVEELEALQALLGADLPWSELTRAARWHDLGKTHPAFQEMLLAGLPEDDPRREGGPWAKSEGPTGAPNRRKHFRHELASALALLEHGGSDLAAYLVAAHHGRVRLSIRSRPGETKPDAPDRRFALGIWEGDELPPADLGGGVRVPATRLRLDLMELGERERPSWLARTLDLVETHGPFRLAFMEALVRVADWRGTARRRGG